MAGNGSETLPFEPPEQENIRLREENARLRRLLAAHSIPIPQLRSPRPPSRGQTFVVAVACRLFTCTSNGGPGRGIESETRSSNTRSDAEPAPVDSEESSNARISIVSETGKANRIAARKQRDREARRQQIVSAARRIAEVEGWPAVTIRRLSDEIAYSQPVLYSHFESREEIVDAVALEGFKELGAVLKKVKKRGSRGSGIEAVANAYLVFAASSPALYEAMFSFRLAIPFGDASTPPELRFAFSQILELFQETSTPEVLAELFWAILHGIAELTRTARFPRIRQKWRLKALVELFEPIVQTRREI